MAIFKYATLVLLALRTAGVFAAPEVAEEEIASPPLDSNIAVSVTATFPRSEIFGVKLVNGHATKALLDFHNEESESVHVALVGGGLSTLQPLPPGSPPSAAIIRNITGTRYDIELPAGERTTLQYSFTNDLNPQELQLNLVAVLTTKAGGIYQLQAYNGTVSVVEAPTSFFDPQIIFLYLVLLGAASGTIYFVYKTWIEALFPQTRRGGKGGERAKRSSGGSKKAVAPKDQVSVIGADGPAVTTGSLAQKAYDESWIPEHHINRPVAKRVKSGATSKSKARAVTP